MDFVVECKKQFDEMMASKGQPDHEYHLENYQCLALNITPEMLDEIIRLRAEVEKLRRVRDAAEAYRSVSTLRGYAPAQAAWETLCAALDAAKDEDVEVDDGTRKKSKA